jgi:hypothetical protein
MEREEAARGENQFDSTYNRACLQNQDLRLVRERFNCAQNVRPEPRSRWSNTQMRRDDPAVHAYDLSILFADTYAFNVA